MDTSNRNNLGNYQNPSIQNAFKQSTTESIAENNSRKTAIYMILPVIEDNMSLQDRKIKPTSTEREYTVVVGEIVKFTFELEQLKQKIIDMDSSACNKEYIEAIDDINNVKKTIDSYMKNNTLNSQTLQEELDKIQKNTHTLLEKINKFVDEQKAKTNDIAKSSEEGAIKEYSHVVCNLIKNYCKPSEYLSKYPYGYGRSAYINHFKTYIDFFAKTKTEIENQRLKNKAHITETLNKLIDAFNDVTVNIENEKPTNENIPEIIDDLMVELHDSIKNENNLELSNKIEVINTFELDFVTGGILKRFTKTCESFIQYMKDEDLKTKGTLRKIWDFIVSLVTTIVSVLYNILLMTFSLLAALGQMPFRLLASLGQKKSPDETTKVDGFIGSEKVIKSDDKSPDETLKNS